MRKLILLGIIFLMTIVLMHGLTLTGPSWTPSAARTNDTLNCSWTYSIDTIAQNITLLNDSIVYTSVYENASEMTLNTWTSIAAGTAKKGEQWTCQITLFNETNNLTQQTNITILNSVPSISEAPAGIFWNGSDIGYTFTVLEDTNYSIDVNATDLDGDTLTYLSTDPFCYRISSTLGTYWCLPTNDYLDTPTLSTKVNISFTVHDGSDGVVRIVSFNITPINDYPSFSLSDQSMYQNETLNVTVIVVDEESDNFTFNVMANSSLNYSTERLDGSSFIITFTPTIFQTGNFIITVNVTDLPNWTSTNRTTVDSFNLVVLSVNHAPNITNISNTAGTQNQAYTVVVNATDLDNQTLLFSIAAPNCPYANLWNITSSSAYNETTHLTSGNGTISAVLNNSHVVCRNVTIQVNDGFDGEDEEVVLLNITNVNDAPQLFNYSNRSDNTYPTVNVYTANLTAYAYAPFIYHLNYTDIDNLTYEGEILSFSDNTSLFTITSQGVINFTPNQDNVSATPYSITINVTDDGGLSDGHIAYLTIVGNSPPYFDAEFQNHTCYEYDSQNYPYTCLVNVSNFTHDTDLNDYVASFASNDSTFSLNATTGMLNVSITQSMIGNHSLNISVEDTYGAENWTLFRLEILNTNNPPNLQSFTLPRLVEEHTITQLVVATDSDLDIAADELTFSIDTNASFAALAQLSNTSARWTIAPLEGSAGTYYANITVTDQSGNTSLLNFTLLVYNQTLPPSINNITPYGTPLAASTTFSWVENNLTNFPYRRTGINLTENITITLNHSTTLDNPLANNATYTWYRNASVLSTGLRESNHTLNVSLDFFSAGSYNYTLFIVDDYYQNSSFSWIATVENVNRPPILNSSLSNKTVNGTTTFSSYLSSTNTTPQRGFFDPDDDLNSNSYIEGNESNHLSYTASVCSIATLTMSGNDLTVIPNETGVCTVIFTADDGSATVNSNLVTINITGLLNTTTTTTTTSSGGGTSTRTISIPLPEEVDRPVPLKIVTPRLVVIFKNQTLQIPLDVHSTWNDTLYDINLSVDVNVSNITATFDQSHIPSLSKNETKAIMLTLSNYRSNGTYELQVVAKVASPEYEDRATIFVNSLEKSSSGDEVNTKVTFARDLLGSNPECQELNELLTRAEDAILAGNTTQGVELINAVIEGCKYLVNKVRLNQEQPQRQDPLRNIRDIVENNKTLLLFGVGLLALLVGILITGRALKKS
ncbi:MAG: hypothetical protein V1725_02030 [archaeon]